MDNTGTTNPADIHAVAEEGDIQHFSAVYDILEL
jgi:hypothetical protein